MFITGILSIIGSGGPRYIIKAPPVTTSNAVFEAKLTPVCSNGCTSFILSIRNLSDKDIELDWNKTLFIANGTTSGGFMFEGVLYRDRNNQKAPDMIFAKGTFTKAIYPNNLVEYRSGQYGGWDHTSMGTGENGVYLTVKVGNEEIKEKITTNISVSAITQ